MTKEPANEFPVYPGWETVRLIGRGSFGAVYEIERDVFGKVEKAALKQISIPQDQSDVEELYSTGYDDASITAHYQSYLADIVKEYQMMSDMKGHTNIVNCDDIRYVQKDSGIGWDIYMKMELLTPMMKSLDRAADEEQVIKLGKDMANALVLCHHRNIIHRDIKPQNIFLSKDGDFKLGDFGIAKTAEKTTGGTKIGTYNYMAPEVYNNQPYGHEADIYSLGMVLYWLLNERRLPFYPAPPAVPKSSEMDKARLRRFQGEEIPAPMHGSPALQRIVLKACAYNPKDRYRTAEEMLQDLDELGRGEPVFAGGFVQTYDRVEEAEDDRTLGVFGGVRVAGTSGNGEESYSRGFQEEIWEENTEGTVGVFGFVEPEGFIANEGEIDLGPQTDGMEEESTVSFYDGANYIQGKNKLEKKKKEKKQKPAKKADEESEKKKKVGLIIAAAAAVLAIAALALYFLLPRYGAWSEWSTVKPNEIEGRKIETGTESRYRDYTLVSTTDKTEVVGKIERETVELAAWSEWGDWQEEPIEANDNRGVESGVQYRTQSRETTTSEDEELEGWTKYDTTTVEEYGNWHAWTTEQPAYKDGRKTSSKTQYCAFTRDYRGDTYQGLYYVSSGSDWRDSMDFGNSGSLYRSYTLSDGTNYREYVYYLTRTVYSYQDLEEKTVNCFYRWGDWSDWSLEEAKEDEDTKVETRTVYHGRVKVEAPVYYYYGWSDWSDWIQGTETASDTREVETRTVYRYADRDS